MGFIGLKDMSVPAWVAQWKAKGGRCVAVLNLLPLTSQSVAWIISEHSLLSVL